MAEYHLSRLFCIYGNHEKVSRGWGGYLTEVGDEEREWYTDLVYGKSWGDYHEYRSIVLLGPRRFGKTSEFKFQAKKTPNGFYLALRDLSERNDLASAFPIGDEKRFESWRCGVESGELFIDSLDEGELEAKNLLPKITRWLHRLGDDVLGRLRVHVSCRENDWHACDMEQWSRFSKLLRAAPEIKNDNKEELNGTQDLYIELALLELSRSALAEACLQKDVPVNDFLNKFPNTARPLIVVPQTLNMVLTAYKENGVFITDLRDLYERTITLQLLEKNEFHSKYQDLKLPRQQKREMVGFYALISVLSGREVIDWNAERSHQSYIPMELGTWDAKEVLSLFKSELFEPYASDAWRFSQPDLANYLAAVHLDEILDKDNVSINSVISLLFLATDVHCVAPRLRGLAAWLAVINSRFRKHLLAYSPLTLLHESQDELGEEDKQCIWHSLEKRYGKREWFNDLDIWNFRHLLGGIALKNYFGKVIDKKNSFGTNFRLLVLDTVQKSVTEGISEKLVAILYDLNEPIVIRRAAGEALVATHPEMTRELMGWLFLNEESDPECELLSVALRNLFPKHIGVESVFSVLRDQKSENHSGAYQSYLYDLPSFLTPSQLDVALNIFSSRLFQKIECFQEQRKSIHKRHYSLEYKFQFFLIERIKKWDKVAGSVRWLERWIAQYESGIRCGLISHGQSDVTKVISQKLMRELVDVRIHRLCKEGKGDSATWFYSSLEVLNINKENLEYWWKKLLISLEEKEPVAQYYWPLVKNAYCNQEYPISFLDGVVSYSKKYQLLAEWWDEYRQIILDEGAYQYRKESAVRNKKCKNEQETAKSNIARTALTEPLNARYLLTLITNYSFRYGQGEDRDETWLEYELGGDVATAYYQALNMTWYDLDHEAMLGIWHTNNIPWEATWTNRALKQWIVNNGTNWQNMESTLRQSAIVAVFFDTDWHDWMPDLILSEWTFSQSLISSMLDKEAVGKNHPSIAAYLCRHGEWLQFCEIAQAYLLKNSDLRLEVARPLMGCVLTKEVSPEVCNRLLANSKEFLEKGNNERALFYLCAAFSQQPKLVWPEIKNYFLKTGKIDKENFCSWLSEIENYHVEDGIRASWPVWMPVSILMELLPILFKLYPPHCDPSLKESNSTNPKAWQREQGAGFRRHALKLLSESGDPSAKSFLVSALDESWAEKTQDQILHAIDIWQQAYAEESWKPLSPESLLTVLTGNVRLVRSHIDLFSLMVAIVEDIRYQVEKGEVDFHTLLWHGKQPVREDAFQNLLIDKIKGHSWFQRKNIVGAREVAVKAKFPDIFVACKLPEQPHEIRLYLELKRQHNEELFSSPKQQLADLYLKDRNAQFGLYVVIWYGQRFACGKYARDYCGRKPQSALELEECLQKICDGVVAVRPDINDIKAIVFNVEKSS